MGARVIAAASNDAKRTLAREQGADDVVDYTQPDWRLKVIDMTGGKGADVIYDPVGAIHLMKRFVALPIEADTWSLASRLVAFHYSMVNMPLVKGYDLVGVRYDIWRDGW